MRDCSPCWLSLSDHTLVIWLRLFCRRPKEYGPGVLPGRPRQERIIRTDYKDPKLDFRPLKLDFRPGSHFFDLSLALRDAGHMLGICPVRARDMPGICLVAARHMPDQLELFALIQTTPNQATSNHFRPPQTVSNKMFGVERVPHLTL